MKRLSIAIKILLLEDFELSDGCLCIIADGDRGSEGWHVVVGEYKACGELHAWCDEQVWCVAAEVVLYLFSYPQGTFVVKASHVGDGVGGGGQHSLLVLERHFLTIDTIA